MIIGINALFLFPGEGGGIERFLRNLLPALDRIGKQNQYILFTNKDCSGTFVLPETFTEFSLCVSARFRPAKILAEQMILPFAAKAKGVDVMLSVANITPLFLFCPKSVIIHDCVPFSWWSEFSWSERVALQLLLRLSAIQADKIIADSHYSAKEIARFLGVRKKDIDVFYGAADPAFEKFAYHDQKTQGPECEFILCSASAKPHKNLAGMFSAYRILQDKYGVTMPLVVTHTAETVSDIYDLAKQHKVDSMVFATGPLTDDGVALLYSCCRVFVYPSLFEGFGLPVLEAMACGAPVVCSAAASLPEVGGNAVLYADPQKPEEMAHATARLLADEHLSEEFSFRGRERTRAFSWDDYARKVLARLLSLSKSQNR